MAGNVSDWNPNYYAVSVVQRPDPGGERPTTLSVRHPTVPCECGKATDDDAQTREQINAYLVRLTNLSKEHKIPNLGFKLIEASEGKLTVSADEDVEGRDASTVELEWRPRADEKYPRWNSSFYFERLYGKDDENTKEGNYRERTLVMLATSVDETEPRIGIRVVAHVRSENNGAKEELLVTSMSASLPVRKPGKKNSYQKRETSTQAKPLAKSGKTETESEALAVLLSGAAAVATDKYNSATKGPSESVERVPELAVFLQDPISQKPKTVADRTHSLRERRPSGDEETLKLYLKESHSVQSASIKPDATNDQQGIKPTLLRLMRSNFVGDGRQNPFASDSSPRSNDFSAFNGLRHSLELFERFKRYSIEPERYFRSAELPLNVHYRSGMPYGPGRDGQTVNAAVQPVYLSKQKRTLWRRHQIAPDSDQRPPRLELRLALANHSHRGRRPVEGRARSPAEPLGIAADPRWMWHELGHVLLMASTGELEMRFAHSPGDALAAIISDPNSDFVGDEAADEDAVEKQRKRRWRGATFPWVFIPRRHDRCVNHGWSWSGTMHRPLRELPDSKQPRRKGYRSEQILSTSLFRLYLCLGGHTPNRGDPPLNSSNPALERRKAASDYTLFLIMKGLGLLGDARIVPANHPDQLVSALIDADISTETFNPDAGAFKRVGGCAHKVIRWAFEAQGLYAGNEKIGKPPEVDVYIKEGRPTQENWLECPVVHGPGSYVPVSLEEPGPNVPDNELPPWFASNGAIEVLNDNRICFTVGNRGSEAAKEVTVTVYCTKWDGTELPPHWAPPEDENQPQQIQVQEKRESWQKIGAKKIQQAQGLSKHSEVKEVIELSPWPPAGTGDRYLILVQATCPADRANTDQETGLPCSRTPTPLVDLVANDNNLGLIAWPLRSTKEEN